MPLSTKKWQIGTKDFWVHAECKEAQECSRGKQESQEDNFSAKLDASQFLNQKFEKVQSFPPPQHCPGKYSSRANTRGYVCN
ncbi:uncharacterized protein LOC143836782 isoform X5 [Paroedura picta]|uniref:uncharacterized protein LOC143836782 isoform X5 n=1 Tax=Paroedura picta TaxID=143630 RepID=UPI0040579EC7